MKIDSVDTSIIGLLEEDGRIANKEIARRLDVSEGTVRNRIARLMKNGYLKVKGLIHPDKNPDYQLVLLGAKVAVSSDLRSSAAAIAKMPYVKAVTVVTGRYDLLIEVFLPNHELITFISEVLSKDGSVVSTESFVAIESVNKWI